MDHINLSFINIFSMYFSSFICYRNTSCHLDSRQQRERFPHHPFGHLFIWHYSSILVFNHLSSLQQQCFFLLKGKHLGNPLMGIEERILGLWKVEGVGVATLSLTLKQH